MIVGSALEITLPSRFGVLQEQQTSYGYDLATYSVNVLQLMVTLTHVRKSKHLVSSVILSSEYWGICCGWKTWGLFLS